MVKSALTFIIMFFGSFAVHAACTMTSPEITLKCFDKYARNNDLNSLETLFLERLRLDLIANSISMDSKYKIIGRRVYQGDESSYPSDSYIIWDKKGNVGLEYERYSNEGTETNSMIFTEVDGKWFIVQLFGRTICD